MKFDSAPPSFLGVFQLWVVCGFWLSAGLVAKSSSFTGHLTVRVPMRVTEGDGTRTQAGELIWSAARTTDLVVRLRSSDPAQVLVPEVVTIPAGQTQATFDVIIPDNNLTDGQRTVYLEAITDDFSRAVTEVIVADNDVRRLTFNYISSPQYAEQPVPVTITAEDIQGERVTSFAGAVALRATSAQGDLVPSVTNAAAFKSGQWTGQLIFKSAARRVELQAFLGEQVTGASLPFNVDPAPVREMPWRVQDACYDQTTGCLYATVYDSDSIVQWDPLTGATRATIPLGEPLGPAALAGYKSRAFVISQDGRFGFVVVSNGYYLRQVDLQGRSLGPRFAVGSDFGGPMFALDMFALPGQNRSLVVAGGRSFEGLGVFVYDNGIVRPESLGRGISAIEPSDLPGIFYGYNGSDGGFQLWRVHVRSTGIVATDATRDLLYGFHADFVAEGGRIISSSGNLVDPEARQLLGVFQMPSFTKVVAADAALGRAFFGALIGPTYRLQASDIATRVVLGTFDIKPSDPGGVARLFRWGTNGLGLLTSSARLYLVQTAALIPTEPSPSLTLTQSLPATPIANTAASEFGIVLTVTNAGPEDAYEVTLTDVIPPNSTFLAVSPSQGTSGMEGSSLICQLGFLPKYSQATVRLTLRPTVGGWLTNTASVVASAGEEDLSDNISRQPIFVQISPPAYGYAEIRQPAADLVYHPPTGLIYATVGSDSGPFSDSLLPIDPETGVLSPAFSIGPQPGKAVLSENQMYLYFVSETNRAIRRWTFLTNGVDLIIPVSAASGGQHIIEDLEMLPGGSESLAVLRASFGFSSEVAIYDGAEVRPVVAGVFGDGYPERIEVGENPVRVYAQNDGVQGFARVEVAGDGARLLDTTTTLNPLFGGVDFAWSHGRLFTSYGPIIDPSIPAIVDHVPGVVAPALVTYERSANRLFYLQPHETSWQIRAYDASNLQLISALVIRNVLGTPASLIRCGNDRLAFRTSGGQIFIVRLPFADQADLAIAQQHWPDSVAVGLDFTLLVQVTNHAAGTAGGIIVSNQLPAQTELRLSVATQGAIALSNRSVVWQVGSLPAAGAASLTLQMRATNSDARTVTNLAEIVSAVPDPATSNNISLEAILLVPNLDARAVIISQTESDVRATAATLRAWVNPNRLATQVYFEYGLDANDTHQTAPANLASNSAPVEVAIVVTNLCAHCSYHYRVVATNAAGTTFGPDKTFVTSLQPEINTLTASDIELQAAALNALVDTHGVFSRVYFEYGPSVDFGLTSAALPIPDQSATCLARVLLDGLSPATLYHARVVVSNSVGVFSSPDLTFTTLPLFTVSTGGLPGVSNGALGWGDYDRDGWLDVLLTGNTGGTAFISRLYHNNGDGTFTQSAVTLPGVINGAVAWGDYDNDGFLDFYLAGEGPTGVRLARIYRNLGNGTFTDINAGLPGLVYGAVAWGDYDRDGQPDLLFSGINQANTAVCLLYRNDRGLFRDVSAGLPGFASGSLAWGDFDNDGAPDILLSGGTATGVVTRVYRNESSGALAAFTALPTTEPPLAGGVARWSDCDNDGYLDYVLLGARDDGTYVIELFRNLGHGTFAKADAGIPGSDGDTIVWGDYDLDGYLDILMTGEKGVSSIPDTVNRSLYLFINNRHGTFDALNLGLPEIWSSASGWADFDNDGRLDFLVCGSTRSGLSSRLYRNNLPLSNRRPGVPINLSTTIATGQATLSWSAALDAEANVANLTYNVWLTRAEGGPALISPQSLPSGRRLVAEPGNAGAAPSLSIRGLEPGSYLWTVQAVDSIYAGSEFAPLQRFDHGIPVFTEIDKGNGQLRLKGKAVPNSAYFLQTSSDLKAWSLGASLMTDGGGIFDLVVPIDPPAAAFYRLATH